ncbi:MAG: ribose-5-phosphate isomerase RpiA [Proteobacteria bacterium]|nr:ribose-5-phosphate isomerase RpiA [Pseudomonadota bacterium]
MTRKTAADLKRDAAIKALEFVEDGMKLGLGTGSTAEAFLEVLAPKVRGGLNIMGVPTSERTAQRCRELSIPLGSLEQLAPLDLTIDGADETDRSLNLIKGGGGAHLREKIVAISSKRMVVIADKSKLVRRLGKFPLPVEVIPYGKSTTLGRMRAAFAKLGYGDVAVTLREKDGEPFKTDSGNIVFDCAFGAIQNAPKLAAALDGITGVVEHGLFIGIASALVIAGPKGADVITRR